jgi:hypothetical protein
VSLALRLLLKRHPDTPCDAFTAIEVELSRLAPRRLLVRYFMHGDARHVRWPDLAEPAQRTDGLWQHTCFEAFIRPEGAKAYYEFNLVPSLHWAAYRFSGYRTGMKNVSEVGPPRGDAVSPEDKANFVFSATLEMERLVALPLDRPWRLGFSAIVEENNGCVSYWALAHPPGKPDFHHPDCFAFELPAARPIPSPRT